MRYEPLLLLCLCTFASCDIQRDLTPERFACAQGGTCPGDGGPTADLGPSLDAGPDAGASSCDPFFGGAQACGGDPLGSWVIEEVCGDGRIRSELISGCPGATLNSSDVSGTGTLQFFPNGEYLFSQVLQGNLTTQVPPQCSVGIGISCATIQMGLVFDGFTGTVCTTSASGCQCSWSGSNSANETGSYTVEADRIQMLPDVINPYEALHCVSNGVLQFSAQGTGYVTRGQ